MNQQQIAQVSVSLQELCGNVERFLRQKAGEPVGFVMVIATGYVCQYVSNASRADGEAMLQSLFDGWKARRADIPAHYNPDLAKINHAPEAEYDSWFPITQPAPAFCFQREEDKAVRVLDATDPFCPKCGHNRDASSVSSVDHGDGKQSCQKCGATWCETADPRIYGLLNLLRDCMEYLQCDPSAVGGRPEAERLVERIKPELAQGVGGTDGR